MDDGVALSHGLSTRHELGLESPTCVQCDVARFGEGHGTIRDLLELQPLECGRTDGRVLVDQLTDNVRDDALERCCLDHKIAQRDQMLVAQHRSP